MFEIVDCEIEIDKVIAKVSSPEAGAIASFIGVTRNFTGDMKVTCLQYEAYPSMAISMMKKIGAMSKSSYDIKKIAITHRIGDVSVGEASVVIAVSASHRKPAFQACEYAIDTLKEIVPIWKKELMIDGTQKWIANNPEL